MAASAAATVITNTARIWPDSIVGPKGAYTNYPDEFAGASFIWTQSLTLDNHILCRVTVVAP